MLVRATSRQRNSSKLKKNENEFRLEVSRVQPLFLGRDMDNKMWVFIFVTPYAFVNEVLFS
jgi:hypothetical protein